MKQEDMDRYLDEAAEMFWSEYALLTYGEPLGFWEAVRREHSQLPVGRCIGKGCEFHGD